MPAGMYVKGDHGVTQIDENYFNFALRYKGTAVCNTAWNTGGVTKYRTALWFDTLSFPLMAVRSNNGVCMYAVNRPVPDTQQFHFVSKTPNESFDYWLFDALVPNSGNAGLEVFNAAGQLCYGSGSKPLRIVGGFNGAGQISAPSGRQVAVIQNSNGFAWDTDGLLGDPGGGGGSFEYFAWLAMSRVNGNTAYGLWDKLGTNFERYASSSNQGSYVPSPAPLFLVADVTNY